MSRVRKAIVAGVLAAFGAFTTATVEGNAPSTTEGWVGLIAGAVAAGVVAGAATYAVRNAGTVNGSDPIAPGTPRV